MNLFFLLPLFSAATIPIRHLGLEDGLSNYSANCITQDTYGFVWVGTYDGLNRYDGYGFRVYRNRWNDQGSLINNHIKALNAADSRVYVGTEKGITFFDYRDIRFHSLYYKNDRQPVKITSDINAIVHDASGNVYVGSGESGLIRFNAGDTVGIRIPYMGKIQNNAVECLTWDRKGNLWMVIRNKGLARYGRDAGNILLINREILTATSITFDDAGRLWIGGNAGINIYEPTTGNLNRFSRSDLLTAHNVSHLLFSHGELWISTNGSGINIWSLSAKKMRFFLPGESGRGLRSGAVASVFEDNEGRKWIATLRGEVNVLDNRVPSFRGYSHDAGDLYSLAGNFVRAFTEDERHNVWIGISGKGLDHWDRRTGRFTHYRHRSGKGFLSSDLVVSLLNDSPNRLWIATFNGGIDALDKSTGIFRHYTCMKPGGAVEEKNFWKLFKDLQGHLWATSTWGGALYLLNRKADRFELFDPQLMDIHTLFQDHLGNLWGGNYTHLIRIDTVNRKHHTFFIGQAIRAISEDMYGRMWVGTEGGGLLMFDSHLKLVKRFTEKDGLPSNSVLNILVDRQGRLWCSTYNGLTCFNTQSQKFTNYFSSDGLLCNQFLYNAALLLKSGEMLFGGVRGFNAFWPETVSAYIHQPRIELTDVTVNGRSLERSAYGNGRSLHETLEITIPNDEASLMVGFSGLEYSNPEKISYAYMLSGLDHRWNYIGKVKSANFSRLHEGSYILKIKATNTDGVWSTHYRQLKIMVLPPWYRTWLAYLCYASVVISAIYVYLHYRKRQIALHYEIKIANLEKERERESSDKKLSFFTNISHEFRAPLTLIINPIKDVLKQGGSASGELQIAYRNARRLLGLVDHLLLFRKTESETPTLQFNNIDFAELCKDVYQCFNQQMKTKGIRSTFQLHESVGGILADRSTIEIALFNLVSNAVKFTPEGGVIDIEAGCIGSDVYFKIADSGPGIPQEVGDKLFEKYYQAGNASSLKTGFGIGLYLVKTFVGYHDGSIQYESVLHKGTTFTLTLPARSLIIPVNGGLETSSLEENITGQLIDHDNLEVLEEELAVSAHLELLISDRQSILVVDDNKDIRTYIKRIFSKEYNIHEAENGIIGLEMTRKHLPDVIICDVVMPELDGLEFCRILKNDTAISQIPILLLTGENTSDLQLRSIREGATDFISKPFDKEMLTARIHRIIADRKDLQNYFYNEVTLQGERQHISSEEKDFLYRFIDIVEAMLDEQSIPVNSLADKLRMSYSNLYKRIKQITGLSLNGFIRYIRLRKAAEMMINTRCTVNEAAFRVGYSDVKYFREHFNKQFGMNPSGFIKKHRTAFQKTYRIRKT